MKIIKFNNEKEYINEFINLPKKIYTNNDNMENPKEMKKLLLGTHPLSKYFKLHKFIIIDNEKCVGRFCITIYPNDKNAYIGFYECIDEDKVSKYLFNEANKFVKKIGYKKIIGPVDASFWYKYRLKINLFDKRPYTCEPYNKSYYLKQFKDNGYKVIEHYTSNIYDVISDEYENKKYSDRYNEFIKLGYDIISPKIEDFDSFVNELYYLITSLYSDFPIYKDITLDDFCSMFIGYKSVVNMNMIKAAYYDKKLVGFFISLPNYNNLAYHLNLINIIKILKIKKKPNSYVLLYMGVNPEHKGLGKALASSIIEELRINKLPSIGALARDGKITQNYADDLIDTRYEYVLLEKEIK